MHLSLFKKLFLSILLVCLAMLAAMTILINSSFREGLQNYINEREVAQVEQLALKVSAYYSSTYGWRRLILNPAIWASLLRRSGEMPPPREMMGRSMGDHLMDDRPPPKIQEELPTTAFVPITLRMNLLDLNGHSILGMPENLKMANKDIELTKVEILYKGELVGWLSIIQSKRIAGTFAESFFQQQMSNIYYILSIVALITFLFASLLVRHFLKPLGALHTGASAIERGDLDFRIEVTGSDELAQLIIAFNRLADTLKQQKLTRDQWLSDISHELRTPLAVLRSEIEAIQDGIRKPEPSRIASLHQQVLNLGQLVEDIYELSLSDSGINIVADTRVDVTAIIENVVEQNRVRFERKNLAVEKRYVRDKEIIFPADEKSLIQLFTNLLENCYRYTDENGKVAIALEEGKDEIHIVIEDSSPGVPGASLPRLFDRLYRVDKSRSRANGGSGLGLSICKNIVQAHQGVIFSEHSELGGLKVGIILPNKVN